MKKEFVFLLCALFAIQTIHPSLSESQCLNYFKLAPHSVLALKSPTSTSLWEKLSSPEHARVSQISSNLVWKGIDPAKTLAALNRWLEEIQQFDLNRQIFDVALTTAEIYAEKNLNPASTLERLCVFFGDTNDLELFSKISKFAFELSKLGVDLKGFFDDLEMYIGDAAAVSPPKKEEALEKLKYRLHLAVMDFESAEFHYKRTENEMERRPHITVGLVNLLKIGALSRKNAWNIYAAILRKLLEEVKNCFRETLESDRDKYNLSSFSRFKIELTVLLWEELEKNNRYAHLSPALKWAIVLRFLAFICTPDILFGMYRKYGKDVDPVLVYIEKIRRSYFEDPQRMDVPSLDYFLAYISLKPKELLDLIANEYLILEEVFADFADFLPMTGQICCENPSPEINFLLHMIGATPTEPFQWPENVGQYYLNIFLPPCSSSLILVDIISSLFMLRDYNSFMNEHYVDLIDGHFLNVSFPQRIFLKVQGAFWDKAGQPKKEVKLLTLALWTALRQKFRLPKTMPPSSMTGLIYPGGRWEREGEGHDPFFTEWALLANIVFLNPKRFTDSQSRHTDYATNIHRFYLLGNALISKYKPDDQKTELDRQLTAIMDKFVEKLEAILKDPKVEAYHALAQFATTLAMKWDETDWPKLRKALLEIKKKKKEIVRHVMDEGEELSVSLSDYVDQLLMDAELEILTVVFKNYLNKLQFYNPEKKDQIDENFVKLHTALLLLGFDDPYLFWLIKEYARLIRQEPEMKDPDAFVGRLQRVLEKCHYNENTIAAIIKLVMRLSNGGSGEGIEGDDDDDDRGGGGRKGSGDDFLGIVSMDDLLENPFGLSGEEWKSSVRTEIDWPTEIELSL